MCYGMNCPYEQWNGECIFSGTRRPGGAACVQDEEDFDEEIELEKEVEEWDF